jgi:hypothetical protein
MLTKFMLITKILLTCGIEKLHNDAILDPFAHESIET